jgi:hypothetical protein
MGLRWSDGEIAGGGGGNGERGKRRKKERRRRKKGSAETLCPRSVLASVVPNRDPRAPARVTPSCPPWRGPGCHACTLGHHHSWSPPTHQWHQPPWCPTVGQIWNKFPWVYF